MEKESKEKSPQKAIQSVIIMLRHEQMECWGSISEVCRIHGFNYHTLIKKKFPFMFGGWVINKVPFRQKSDELMPLKNEKK